MKTNTLLKFISATVVVCFGTLTAFAQQPPPGSQPPPPGTQPPRPGTQLPPPTATPPPRSTPPLATPPPATPPPLRPPLLSTPPPTRLQPPPLPGTQPPRPPGTQPPPPTAPARFGAPLPGLTPEQLAAFNAGSAAFRERENVASGLGPIFNDRSCVACHNAGGPGGASRIFVTRFGHTEAGVFDPLADLGGSLLQRRAINRAALEVVPPEANTVARRQTTALFGLGLIEAIPDAAIIALAARPEVDGVSGRPSLITDVVSGEQRVGRFGWKAQQATILAFSGDAYLNEMGITNRLFPDENAPNGKADVLAQFDKVSDIEDEVDPVTGRSDIDDLTDFQRLLGAPPVRPLSVAAKAGRALFGAVGCAVCHTPELRTGPSPVAALSEKPVVLFSDLLLHDMGALGDGIAQADAGPREMRTAPLWGIRGSAPYLHDGRAPNLDRAIRAHEGEGAVARDRYQALTPTERAQLVQFVNSL